MQQATGTETTADDLQALTATYTERVKACTGRLGPTVEQYAADREAFEESVYRLSTAESRCDETRRDLGTLVGRSGPNFTGVYLQAGDVMELFDRVDRVPTRAEEFVEQLAAMRPALSADAVAAFRRMAACIDTATGHLSAATEATVESLCAVGASADIAEHVERVRALESECDAVRYELLAGAFDGGPDPAALAVRALVEALDAVADAAEDAADQLVYVVSADC